MLSMDNLMKMTEDFHVHMPQLSDTQFDDKWATIAREFEELKESSKELFAKFSDDVNDFILEKPANRSTLKALEVVSAFVIKTKSYESSVRELEELGLI